MGCVKLYELKMIERFVGKSGYWIYDKSTGELAHSETYPRYVKNITDWIYVDGPGKVRIKNDKILDFTPEHRGFDNLEQDELKCWVHKPKEYIGFTEKYFYCSICGTKL